MKPVPVFPQDSLPSEPGRPVQPAPQSMVRASVSQNGQPTLALTERMRVLLHAVPLIELKQAENRRDPEFRHYDALSLAMKVVDLLVEQMGMDAPIGREEIFDQLQPILEKMDAANSVPVSRRRHQEMVNRVLSGLRNDRDSRRPFQIGYQDIGQRSGQLNRQLEFRLIQDEFHPSGRTVLKLSKEAINLYLKALDLDIEDEQAAAEAVLHSQLTRGKLADAVKSAQNSRLQSLRYEEKLNRILRETRRDVSHLDWKTTIPQLLEEALKHIEQRLDLERNILTTTREHLETHAEIDDTLQALMTVQESVEDCRMRHLHLHRQVMQARNIFLEEQARQSFRERPLVFLPALRADVLQPLLTHSMKVCNPVLRAEVPKLVGAVCPPMLSLVELVQWQLQPPRRPPTEEIEILPADLSTPPAEIPVFSPEIREHAAQLLTNITTPTNFSELLAEIKNQPEAALLSEYLSLQLLQRFGADFSSDHQFTWTVERVADQELESEFLHGTELLIVPLQPETETRDV